MENENNKAKGLAATAHGTAMGLRAKSQTLP
jgi:hypothetical protein